MVEGTDGRRGDRAYQTSLMKSYKRLKKLGASDTDAGQIAREVAERSSRRMKAPVFHTDEEFADLVGKVCAGLSEGKSHYELIEEMPFLATGRLDRVVAVAPRTKPPVDARTARRAKRAVAQERMSAGVALLLMALALDMLGLWYAIGVGVVICVATEIYMQAWMPASVRKSAATSRLPAVIFSGATIALILLAYRWYQGVTSHRYLLAFVAAVAVVAIVFLIPGLTLAQLVSRRERRWRRDLEQTLLEKRSEGGTRT